MKIIWPLVYIGMFIGALLLGYHQMEPDRLVGLHPSVPSGCIFAFVLTAVSNFLALRYAASLRPTFPRPSLHRGLPLVDWRYDPLQFLLVLALIALGLLIGSLARLPGSGVNGMWAVALFSCVFLGELTGIVVGCVIYRNHV